MHFFLLFFFFFFKLAVPSRKPAERSSKSIATQCGQMTTRLVWRPTSFHNMWPGLLNRRHGLREKIFPCTKSDLAAGGPWSCEWAASTPAKDCEARRKHSIFLHPADSAAPPTGSIYQWYLGVCEVSSISIFKKNHSSTEVYNAKKQKQWKYRVIVTQSNVEMARFNKT